MPRMKVTKSFPYVIKLKKRRSIREKKKGKQRSRSMKYIANRLQSTYDFKVTKGK